MKTIIFLACLSICAVGCKEERPTLCNPRLAFNDYKAMPPIIEPHPRSIDEMRDDWRREDPWNEIKRGVLDEIDPERAPHSPRDADEFV